LGRLTVSGLLDVLSSAPAGATITAAVLCHPLAGFPTWPALSRGRLASTLAVSLGVGSLVFVLVQRFTAPAAA
jgi:hypothetical protein